MDQIPAEQTMWWPSEIKLHDGKGIVELDFEVLSKKFGSPIKRLIIQRVFKENNKLRIGLVINGPDVIVDEPTSNGEQKQTQAR